MKMNEIGPKVRKIRKSKKLTQEQLAARCNLLEWDLSRGTLAKIESKVRCINDKEVALLARALETDINSLYS